MGGWSSRTQVPFAAAPVTMASKRSPTLLSSSMAAADFLTCRSTLESGSAESLGNRKLVQVAGVVVVYGAPDQMAQIAGLRPGHGHMPLHGLELGQRLGREIRQPAPLEHGPARDALQDGSMFLSVWIGHEKSSVDLSARFEQR